MKQFYANTPWESSFPLFYPFHILALTILSKNRAKTIWCCSGQPSLQELRHDKTVIHPISTNRTAALFAQTCCTNKAWTMSIESFSSETRVWIQFWRASNSKQSPSTATTHTSSAIRLPSLHIYSNVHVIIIYTYVLHCLLF